MKECKIFLVSTAEQLVNCVRHTHGVLRHSFHGIDFNRMKINCSFFRIFLMLYSMGIVEKRDPVLGLQDPWDLCSPWGSATPGTQTNPVPQDPMGPRNSQDPWTLGRPGTSGPQDPWEITSTVRNSESKHPETLKLKHKKGTFLNYIIGQSKRKIACTF